MLRNSSRLASTPASAWRRALRVRNPVKRFCEIVTPTALSSVAWSPSALSGVLARCAVIVLKSEMTGRYPERAIGTFSSVERVEARAELISGLEA